MVVEALRLGFAGELVVQKLLHSHFFLLISNLVVYVQEIEGESNLRKHSRWHVEMMISGVEKVRKSEGDNRSSLNSSVVLLLIDEY